MEDRETPQQKAFRRLYEVQASYSESIREFYDDELRARGFDRQRLEELVETAKLIQNQANEIRNHGWEALSPEGRRWVMRKLGKVNRDVMQWSFLLKNDGKTEQES